MALWTRERRRSGSEVGVVGGGRRRAALDRLRTSAPSGWDQWLGTAHSDLLTNVIGTGESHDRFPINRFRRFRLMLIDSNPAAMANIHHRRFADATLFGPPVNCSPSNTDGRDTAFRASQLTR